MTSRRRWTIRIPESSITAPGRIGTCVIITSRFRRCQSGVSLCRICRNSTSNDADQFHSAYPRTEYAAQSPARDLQHVLSKERRVMFVELMTILIYRYLCLTVAIVDVQLIGF